MIDPGAAAIMAIMAIMRRGTNSSAINVLGLDEGTSCRYAWVCDAFMQVVSLGRMGDVAALMEL